MVLIRPCESVLEDGRDLSSREDGWFGSVCRSHMERWRIATPVLSPLRGTKFFFAPCVSFSES